MVGEYDGLLVAQRVHNRASLGIVEHDATKLLVDRLRGDKRGR